MKKLKYVCLTTCSFLFFTACGMLMGDPSNADVERIAKQQMAAHMLPEGADENIKKAMQAAFDTAKVSKKGICNHTAKEIYACMVDVEAQMPGQASATKQTFVVEIIKGANGWEAAN